MFHLESKVQEWRNTMQAAGVTDAAVLRELESHLREDFTRILHASSPAEAAFADAAKNLGQPVVLKREFDRAVIAPRSRLKRVLFPTNMWYYAIAALCITPMIIFSSVVRLWSNLNLYGDMLLDLVGLSSRYSGPLGLWTEFLSVTLLPILGILGLVAGVAYLHKPDRRWALYLAGFHGFLGWWWALMLVRTLSVYGLGLPGGFRLWGLYNEPLNIRPFSFTALILGGVAFYFWRRELLGVSSGKQKLPHEPETA